jgi:hypothetical protein
METLDGNAIAGLLYEVFGAEVTADMATCATCGTAAHVAEAAVYAYPYAPGAVVRCRSCAGLLMAITQVRGVSCVDLRGVAALEPPRWLSGAAAIRPR